MPDPSTPADAPERLRARLAEKEAVVARIKAYLAPWKSDRRLRVAGEILLREIERIEREEAERAARGDRAP